MDQPYVELAAQLRTLEAMFDDPGLQQLRRRESTHPAVQRYDRLKAYYEQRMSSASFPEADSIGEIAAMAVDRMGLPLVPKNGSYWSFITDPAVRDFMMHRTPDPRQFDDAMAQFYFWCRLREEGFRADLIERDSFPDIVILLSPGQEVWADVKRIHAGTGMNRIRKVITAANSQIKVANPNNVGILFLSIGNGIQQSTPGQSVPISIESVVHEVDRALNSNLRRSVGQVIISWDEYSVISYPNNGALYRFTRKCLIRQHKQPYKQPLIHGSDLEGFDREISFGYRSPGYNGNISIHPEYRKFNDFVHGIRSEHAIETLRNPDASTVDNRHGIAIMFATRRITQARNPYTMLVTAFMKMNESLTLNGAYRLYYDSPDQENLGLYPLEALAELVRRYGGFMEMGEQAGYVIRAAHFRSMEELQRLFKVTFPEKGRVRVDQTLRVLEGGRGIDVSWAYALVEERYRADLVRRT